MKTLTSITLVIVAALVSSAQAQQSCVSGELDGWEYQEHNPACVASQRSEETIGVHVDRPLTLIIGRDINHTLRVQFLLDYGPRIISEAIFVRIDDGEPISWPVEVAEQPLPGSSNLQLANPHQFVRLIDGKPERPRDLTVTVETDGGEHTFTFRLATLDFQRLGW